MAETPTTTPNFMTAQGMVEMQLGLGAQGRRRRGFGDVAAGSVAAAAAAGRVEAEERATMEFLDKKGVREIFATVDVFSKAMIKMADPSVGVGALADNMAILSKETDVLIDKFRMLNNPSAISAQERQRMAERQRAAEDAINTMHSPKGSGPGPAPVHRATGFGAMDNR